MNFSATGSTFRLLTDSQVTLYSIKKAITQPASCWLNTHEPLLRDIVNRLKDLTDAGHHIHLGKVKAHMGVRGNILADAAAKAVVTQMNPDAKHAKTHCLAQLQMPESTASQLHGESC